MTPAGGRASGRSWRRVPRRAGVVVAVLGLSAVVGACSEGSGGDDPVTAGSDAPSTTRGVPATLAARPTSAPGTGSVQVGRSVASFSVTACAPAPDESQPEAARTLFSLDGSGTAEAGGAFTVSVRRFRTGDEVATFTDTVSYADGARILQAQRIEVAGQRTDLRDPDAAGALLRLRPDGVSASGVAGPPGSGAGDEGLVALSLDATCSGG